MTILAFITIITGCLKNEQEPKVVLLETETTSLQKEVETTTQEIKTVQEAETQYQYKGKTLYISIDCENDFILKNGDTIYLNDIVSEETSDIIRGAVANSIIEELSSENPEKIKEFQTTYIDKETKLLKVTYSQNLSFKYTGNKKIVFHYVKKYPEYNEVAFDLYTLE